MIRDDNPFVHLLTIAFKSRGATPNETIWDQMLSKRLDFCKNDCESNRVVCILRPKCEDRRYLDVLLLDDNFRKKIPEFCYSTRIDHMIKAESREKVPHDVYILIDDLATVLLRKKQKKRPFSTNLLQKTLKSVKRSFFIKEGVFILIEANDMLYLVNISQGLVLVNPQKTLITNLELFQLIIRFYSEKNNCTCKINVQGQFVEVTIQSNSDVSPFREITDLPAEVLDYIVASDDKEITLEFELPPLQLGILHGIHKAIGDIKTEGLTFDDLKTLLESIFK